MVTHNEQHADTRDMYAVHRMFRREFSLLPCLVRAVAAGDEARSQLIADHIQLMNGILHTHHHAEDTHLWPRLRARAPRETAPLLDRMEKAHEELGQLAVEIETEIDVWRASAAADRGTALASVLDTLLSLLREHTSQEEREVLPLAEQYVTAREWEDMAQEAVGHVPERDLPLVLGMVMHESEPEVIEHILERMPPDVRPTVKELASRAFAEYSERIFGPYPR